MIELYTSHVYEKVYDYVAIKLIERMQCRNRAYNPNLAARASGMASLCTMKKMVFGPHIAFRSIEITLIDMIACSPGIFHLIKPFSILISGNGQ